MESDRIMQLEQQIQQWEAILAKLEGQTDDRSRQIDQGLADVESRLEGMDSE